MFIKNILSAISHISRCSAGKQFRKKQSFKNWEIFFLKSNQNRKIVFFNIIYDAKVIVKEGMQADMFSVFEIRAVHIIWYMMDLHPKSCIENKFCLSFLLFNFVFIILLHIAASRFLERRVFFYTATTKTVIGNQFETISVTSNGFCWFGKFST